MLSSQPFPFCRAVTPISPWPTVTILSLECPPSCLFPSLGPRAPFKFQLELSQYCLYVPYVFILSWLLKPGPSWLKINLLCHLTIWIVTRPCHKDQPISVFRSFHRSRRIQLSPFKALPLPSQVSFPSHTCLEFGRSFKKKIKMVNDTFCSPVNISDKLYIY